MNLNDEVINRRLEYSKATSYYILSCINQFELPTEPQGKRELVETLVYGIFKPLEHHQPDGHGGQGQIAEEAARQAVLYTTELRKALAFQLRMYRRRGTYPAGINICVFLGAFAISIGLVFADDLGEYTTAHSLALGLLVSWLPILVMFCIVDRNPISGIRNSRNWPKVASFLVTGDWLQVFTISKVVLELEKISGTAKTARDTLDYNVNQGRNAMSGTM
ncbi:hypothetical protein QBC32DRAFT_408466 [Pseudoneurospora amorphoporcata]|uniref:Uncharacterized protein n=1 Tax=Pseudoneurospora amorphoporcata TaxID=241081 RepID=A0AAN6NPB4_9PEZI|nr:hypothetical protein QBC32DRAFT_408466 [Pseudoneurospora amorphoporcata]